MPTRPFYLLAMLAFIWVALVYWDGDHQPPWSKRDLSGKTRKEVLDEYNDGVRLECPSCNRARGAEPAK